MDERENYLKNAELFTEQNTNMIDGILNNMPSAPNGNRLPDSPPLDRVKSPTEKKRNRERER